MVVVSYLQLILVICYVFGHGEGNAHRRKRQATNDGNRGINTLSRNPDGLVSSKNVQFNPSNNPNLASPNNQNNQQQSNTNLLPSSQGQQQSNRARGFYSSPEFKPPSYSGGKPLGWFDTKSQYLVSIQDGEVDKNSIVDGKNAPPSSLQGAPILPRRDDGGAFFLQKVAKQYAGRGEKAFNMGQFNAQKRRGSVCTNLQNFNGYTFGKFPCPLPPGTGMNENDQFCCGSPNYQYCCNAQEFNQDRSGGYGNNVFNDKQRHSKTLHYSPTTRRSLAIVLPIVSILVVAGALAIVFIYYKKLRNEQNKDGKSAGIPRSNDNYSAVPQDPPVERPRILQREEHKTTVQT